MKVVWTDEAYRDLDEISEWIAQDNPTAAARFVAELLARGNSLVRFPKRGRVMPEFGDENIRELLHGDYRIVYRIEDKRIEILSISHGAKPINPEDETGGE